MTITDSDLKRIDARIQSQIAVALDNYADKADTKHVLADSRMTLIEQRLEDVRDELGSLRGEMGSLRGEMGSLRGEVGSLRDEMIDMRQQLTSLAVNIEQAKNVGTYLAVSVTLISLVALFLGLR